MMDQSILVAPRETIRPSFSGNSAPRRLSSRVERPTCFYENAMSTGSTSWVGPIIRVYDTRDNAKFDFVLADRKSIGERMVQRPSAEVVKSFATLRLGLGLLLVGLFAAGLTLATASVIFPIGAGAALFAGGIISAAAVENHQRDSR